MGSELSTGTAELRAQMAAFLRGEGDPQALVEAAQGAELLLPLLGEGAVWSGELDDLRWLFAFTSTGEMHAFLQQKWEAAKPDELPAELARYVRYLRVGGEELLQELLPELVERDRVPMGVVVDVSSGLRAFLPPVSGIVPDGIALDKESVAKGGVGRMVSGGEFGVDPQILKQVSKGINDALDELKKITDATEATTGQGFSDLSVPPTVMGHSGASQMLDDFAERWGWEVQALLDEGDDVAGTLDLNAGYYEEAEEYGTGVLKDVVLSATADPTLTSEKAEKMSWSQVGGKIEDAYTPDYSMDSFQDAYKESRKNLSHAWTDVTETGVTGGHIGVAKAVVSAPFSGDDDGQDADTTAKGK